ncbi:MAG: hypothetical protein ACO3NI_16840, partial [bacterium]
TGKTLNTLKQKWKGYRSHLFLFEIILLMRRNISNSRQPSDQNLNTKEYHFMSNISWKSFGLTKSDRQNEL